MCLFTPFEDGENFLFDPLEDGDDKNKTWKAYIKMVTPVVIGGILGWFIIGPLVYYFLHGDPSNGSPAAGEALQQNSSVPSPSQSSSNRSLQCPLEELDFSELFNDIVWPYF